MKLSDMNHVSERNIKVCI